MGTSDWIAGASAVIALASAGFTFFYSRTQHRLNKLLVAEKEREDVDRKTITLKAELIKSSPSSWILRTTNIGKGTAKGVTVGCQQEDGMALLTGEDISQITPVENLRPGSSFDIKAANWHGMTSPQAVQYNWNDEDGTFGTVKLKVLIH